MFWSFVSAPTPFFYKFSVRIPVSLLYCAVDFRLLKRAFWAIRIQTSKIPDKGFLGSLVSTLFMLKFLANSIPRRPFENIRHCDFFSLLNPIMILKVSCFRCSDGRYHCLIVTVLSGQCVSTMCFLPTTINRYEGTSFLSLQFSQIFSLHITEPTLSQTQNHINFIRRSLSMMCSPARRSQQIHPQ